MSYFRQPTSDRLLQHFEEKVIKDPAHMLNRISISSLFGLARLAALGLVATALMAISGCASSTSAANIQVGPIMFTNASGALQTTALSLNAGQGTYVDVAVMNDPQLLGADWSVYCGSEPPPGTPLPPGVIQDDSCGTFTPTHTMSGPAPAYVTSAAGYISFYTAPAAPPAKGSVFLYATSTANPSKVSMVSLAITVLPILVEFTSAPPSTLSTGASVQIGAVLTNDASNSGVTWTVTCGSSNCGSFNPVTTASGVDTTYTAPATVPAGGTVQVTATSIDDPTKSVTATIAI
jgi:hypothetical protein